MIAQYGISAQGRLFFQKLINLQGCHNTVHYYGIRPHRAGFFLEMNKRTVSPDQTSVVILDALYQFLSTVELVDKELFGHPKIVP